MERLAELDHSGRGFGLRDGESREERVDAAALSEVQVEFSVAAGQGPSVAGDRGLHPETDQVAADGQPRLTLESQADSGHAAGGLAQGRWGEEESRGIGAREQCGQSLEARSGRTVQVQDQQVEEAGAGQPGSQLQGLGPVGGTNNEQPLQAYPAAHGEGRVERAGMVEPGHQSPGRLAGGRRIEGQGRGAMAGSGIQDGQRAPRPAAGGQGRVQGGVPSRDSGHLHLPGERGHASSQAALAKRIEHLGERLRGVEGHIGQSNRTDVLHQSPGASETAENRAGNGRIGVGQTPTSRRRKPSTAMTTNSSPPTVSTAT